MSARRLLHAAPFVLAALFVAAVLITYSRPVAAVNPPPAPAGRSPAAQRIMHPAGTP
jgi:hypothetical protein